MFTSINSLFQIRGNLYATDFLDIFIIGLLLYSLFVFFRKTRTYLVLIGITITIALYFMAKSFNLYVTLIALRYFVGVAALLFVIIFQNEIRRYFEFLGLVGTRQIKVGPLAPRNTNVTEMIQACVKMAQAKIGALIVIKGNDNIDQYIDGGVDIDGILSEELFLSIFDPHSLGHDGAVIIGNNRISKFSAHLPLSTNFKEIGKHGTRHSAALGLTEVTDALCIVVSEEKGSISICRDGKLKTLAQYAELEKELEKFLKSKYTNEKQESFIIRFIKDNFLLKVGAFACAFVIWFFVAYQSGIVHKTYSIPVKLDNLPDDSLIISYTPKEINVNVSGRGNDTFTKFNTDDIKIDLALTKLNNGANKEIITRKNITIPDNVSLDSFEPTTVLMTVQKYFSVDIPIRTKTKGTLQKNTEIKSIVVNPDSIKLWVPQGQQAPVEIETETIDISNQTDSVIVPVKLIIPDGLRLVNAAETVNVAFTIEKKQ